MFSCDDLPPLSTAKCTDINLINVCLLLCAASLWAASFVVRAAEGGWISVSSGLACAEGVELFVLPVDLLIYHGEFQFVYLEKKTNSGLSANCYFHLKVNKQR